MSRFPPWFLLAVALGLALFAPIGVLEASDVYAEPVVLLGVEVPELALAPIQVPDLTVPRPCERVPDPLWSVILARDRERPRALTGECATAPKGTTPT